MRPSYVSCVRSGVIISTRLSRIIKLSNFSDMVPNRLLLSDGTVGACFVSRCANRCSQVRMCLFSSVRTYGSMVSLGYYSREKPKEPLERYESLHGVVYDRLVAILPSK